MQKKRTSIKKNETKMVATKAEFVDFDFNFKKYININFGFDTKKISSTKIKISKLTHKHNIEINISKIVFDIDFDFKGIFVWVDTTMIMSRSLMEVGISLKDGYVEEIKVYVK